MTGYADIPRVADVRVGAAPSRAFSAQYGQDENHGDEGDDTADDAESVNYHRCVPAVIGVLAWSKAARRELQNYLSI